MAFSKRNEGGTQEKKYNDVNRGVLFVNDKEGNDARPDKRGKLLIKADDYTPDADGNVLIYLSAWVKDHATQGEILSIQAQPPRQ